MDSTNQQLSALVTGATGFLGGHVCQQLLAQNWKVYALCRNPEKAKTLDSRIHIIIGDVLDIQSIQDQVPDKLDALFHTAASTNTWFKNNAMQTKTNINGMNNLISLAKQKHIKRFIHTSSVVVFGIHSEIKNITEDMPKAGKDSWINYVSTKTATEEIILNNQEIDKVIINPTHIIGPGDRNNWARLIKMVAEQKLPSIPNGAGSFVDVRNVASGIITAFHKGRNGENYLLGGTDLNFKQFVSKVADKLNVKPTKVQLPNFLLKTLAYSKNFVSRITNKEPDITPESVALISDLYACDSTKARSELNYSTNDFDKTLNDTIAFLKQEELILPN
jgi:nucleoside-diphosphate-sugar epimerase